MFFGFCCWIFDKMVDLPEPMFPSMDIMIGAMIMNYGFYFLLRFMNRFFVSIFFVNIVWNVGFEII